MRMNARHLMSSAAVLAALAGAAPALAQNAFITNTSDNTVSIIDVPSGTLVGAVPVGSEPQGVAVAPDGTTVYVTNLFGPSVSVIDAAQFPQAVVATIGTGAFPPGIVLSPDGSKGFVANGLNTSPQVSVIDTASNSVIATIGLPGTPAGVAITPDGSKVYVANGTTTGQVSVVSTAGNAVAQSIPVGGSPDGIAITPNGAKAYVTQFLDAGSVTVIDIGSNAVSGVIPVGSGPIGIAIAPNGAVAYAANNNDNTVSVIDIASDTVAATIDVGQGPFGVSFTTDGATAYVANKIDNTVSQIDVASNTVVATIAVGSAPAAFGSNFVGKAQPASALLAAVLPGGRSVQTGTTATVFATVLNTSTSALGNCRILLPSSAPAGMSMVYQTTDPATNAVTSGPNPLVSIDGNGSQTFVLAFQGSADALDPGQPLLFVCDGTSYAPIDVGLNTIDLQFSSTPIPDIIVLAATAQNNGIVEVPLSNQQEGAFAVASDNIGAEATLTVSADTGAATLPVTVTLCQTNPSTGQCLAPPAPSVTLDDATGATPTFSVFVAAGAAIPLAPGSSRIFVRFLDGDGVSHGSTSVAVETD
jgi:YVTN family beta-propeller protein